MKNNNLLKSCLLVIFFSNNCNIAISQVTDIDGKTYKTVTIGTQIWMAEDLEVRHYRNGDPIQSVACDNESDLTAPKYATAWTTLLTGALCNAKKPYRDYYVEGGRTYCVLYNGYAVIDIRGVAPEGWHIPSQEEWESLFEYLGGIDIAGVKLKSKNGWDTKYAKNGNNKSGFNALPTGSRDDGMHMAFFQYAYYWSSTKTREGYSYGLQLGNQGSNPATITPGDNPWDKGMAIRCIKD